MNKSNGKISKHIAEGEQMLTFLRNLPESEDTERYIQRFEELVSKLASHNEQVQKLEEKANEPTSALGDNAEKPAEEEGNRNPSIESQMDYHLENLDRMAAECIKYTSMADRLSSVTEEANMREATQLLVDVKQRFKELDTSVHSLKDGYKSLQTRSDLSEEVRLQQLKSLTEFLVNLNKNLLASKECFFTVAKLVKGTVDDRVASGTLVDSSEQNGDQNNTAVAAEDSNEQTKEPLDQELSIEELLKKRNMLLEKLNNLRANRPPKEEAQEGGEASRTSLMELLDSQTKPGALADRLENRKAQLKQIKEEVQQLHNGMANEIDPAIGAQRCAELMSRLRKIDAQQQSNEEVGDEADSDDTDELLTPRTSKRNNVSDNSPLEKRVAHLESELAAMKDCCKRLSSENQHLRQRMSVMEARQQEPLVPNQPSSAMAALAVQGIVAQMVEQQQKSAMLQQQLQHILTVQRVGAERPAELMAEPMTRMITGFLNLGPTDTTSECSQSSKISRG